MVIGVGEGENQDTPKGEEAERGRRRGRHWPGAAWRTKFYILMGLSEEFGQGIRSVA